MRTIDTTLVSPPIGDPLSIPNDGLMSLGIIANKTGGNPEALADKFHKAGLPVEHTGRAWGWVRKRDLPLIFGPDRARSLLFGLEFELATAGPAGHILGVAGGEAIPLCERRGVAVRRTTVHPAASRTGCMYLRKILDYEDTFIIDESDWVDARVALPRIQAAQSTVLSGGCRPDWQDMDVDYSDPSTPRADPYAEAVVRCRWLRIRCSRVGSRRRTVRGPLRVPRFDLFRLLGIRWPDADIARYQEMIAEAHQAVLGDVNPSPSSPVALETKAG
jgi:hypothetical protein